MSGDPFGTGSSFVFRFRMPDGYWICPHTHPIEAHIRVISGTFLVGMGTGLDTGAVRTLAPGGEPRYDPSIVGGMRCGLKATSYWLVAT